MDCSVKGIVKSASCFQCIPQGLRSSVKLYLLCHYASCVPPLAPTNLTASLQSTSTISVTWTEPLGIPPINPTGYTIKWGTSSGNYNVGSATVGAGVFTYQITGLNASTTYFIVVVALNGANCTSTNSDELQSSTTAPAPTLPQAANLILKLESSDFDATPNATQITLWSDHSGVGNDFNLTGATIIQSPANPTVDGVTLCNGHKTVRFNGGNAIGNANSMSFAASPGVEMMVVYKDDSATPGAGDYFFQLMRPGNGTQELQPFADGNFYECFGRTDRPSLGKPAVTVITNFFCYDVASRSDGSSYDAWANSEHFFTSAVYTYAHTQGATQTTIGCAYTGVTNVFATGNVAAVYVWNVVLSATERTQARNYINSVWGVTFP